MIRIKLDTAALSRVRFAISPMNEVFGLLHGLARPVALVPFPQWQDRTRRVIAERHLDLLGSLVAPGYLPDLLTPHPDAAERTADEELDAVRHTPHDRLRAEIAAVANGRPEAALEGRAVPAAVQTLLDAAGAQALLDRLADEMAALWDGVVAPIWPPVRDRIRGDLTRRGAELAERGAAAVLGGLHPALRWRDPTVELDSRFEVDVGWAQSLVLLPSVLSPVPFVCVDPITGALRRRDPTISYPIGATGLLPTSVSSAGSGPPPAVAALLGVTRAGLLCDLTVARSTTELAERHHLSAPAVSYHLGILHRAGLLDRRRRRQSVLYVAADLGRHVLRVAGGRRAAGG